MVGSPSSSLANERALVVLSRQRSSPFPNSHSSQPTDTRMWVNGDYRGVWTKHIL
ncbi:hypothetical protein PC129_g13803 [Phytophthora cactorum]|uniref:Uncharacterized protein n=1 Tax=Phytophthora cactorum TaxID=29920 RepID=A0A8T1HS63_9STRA|nr:hypothetical protein PC111_g22108 [Phytophthora cactorum]KAG2874975.1 hypothetical protein PC114_g24975 [Phytophthora cactorum]KAG2947333.1 hypothetical protein PC117_g6879 [Phytophthora cactorum]KAG2976088.1 hypothetical protein PC119_g22291 [Phytophthora cactorum]KAG3071812.1 hypothetical protein PC122_g15513 [Phytophthora cactorum]